jgi:beta-lactamase superfamily II metal-dependent hydrolase
MSYPENAAKVKSVYYSPFTRPFFDEETDPAVNAVINSEGVVLQREFEQVMAQTPGVSYIPLHVKDHFMIGELKLECFASFDARRKDINANSLAFTLSFESFSVFLTGDITEATAIDIFSTAAARATVRNVNVIQIPHHGYMAGIGTDYLYKMSKPEYALLDCTREEYDTNTVRIQDHVRMLEGLGIRVLKRYDGMHGNLIVIDAAKEN